MSRALIAGEDWALAILGPDGWTITGDRFTRDAADEHVLTLRACDVEAMAVRTGQ